MKLTNLSHTQVKENVIGSAVRLDEIPPEYRKLPFLGRGATTLAFEKDPETVLIFTRDRMKVEWLIHGLHLVKSHRVVNPVKPHHIHGMKDIDLEMIEMPKLYPLSPENRRTVTKEIAEWLNILHKSLCNIRGGTAKNPHQLLTKLADYYEEQHPNSVISSLLQWLMNYDPSQYEFDLGTRQFKQTIKNEIVLLDPIVSSELMTLFHSNIEKKRRY